MIKAGRLWFLEVYPNKNTDVRCHSTQNPPNCARSPSFAVLNAVKQKLERIGINPILSNLRQS